MFAFFLLSVWQEGADAENVFGAVDGGGDGAGAGSKSRSRCRHFHTLCGCRHTRGALKGRLFQVSFVILFQVNLVILFQASFVLHTYFYIANLCNHIYLCLRCGCLAFGLF